MEFKKIFEVIEDAIFNIDSGMWEDMRNSSHAIFSRQDFQRLWVSTSVSKINQGLVPILDNAVEKNILVDLQDVFQRFLFDTSTILMTGYDLKCLSIEMPKVDFGDAVDGVSDAIFYRHVKPAFLWKLQYRFGVGVEKRLRRGLAVFDELLEKIISAKKEDIKSYDTKGEVTDVLTYYGDDAEEFRPERWISASGRLKHEPSYKFLAFNAGPRTCLGKKLTFLQMKTVAVNIIQNYEIQVVEGHKTEPVPSVLRMQHGEKGRRIRELTSLVEKRFRFPQDSVELYVEKVANRDLCAIAQAASLRYKLLGGLAVCRYRLLIFVVAGEVSIYNL
ncbi:unnamed protein product [Brassica oleracea var. botrytis]